MDTNTAFGVANSFGRLGGMVSPFLGQDLIEQGKQQLVQIIFGCLCLSAAIAAVLLNTETSHAKMDGPDDDLPLPRGQQTIELTERRPNQGSRQDGLSSRHMYHDMSRASSFSLGSSPGTGVLAPTDVDVGNLINREEVEDSIGMTTLELN
jgi:hypothetical protein